MMVKKYGFLFWQLPAVQLGNFLEMEIRIEFKKTLKLEAAIKKLKGMWKTHCWKFLQEFKKNKERRISVDTLKEFAEPLVFNADGIQFTRKITGVCGLPEKYSSFDKIWENLNKHTNLNMVRSLNQFWDINEDQFIFRFNPNKEPEPFEEGNEQNIIKGELTKLSATIGSVDSFTKTLESIQKKQDTNTNKKKLPNYSKFVKGSTIKNPGNSMNFPLHSKRCKHDTKAERYRTTLQSKKSPINKNEKYVSDLAGLSQYGQITEALRTKLKGLINKPETANICDLFLMSKFHDDSLTPIVNEFESFSMMQIEHYYGEEQLFKYDPYITKSLLSSLASVDKIVQIKLEESTTDKFSRFDLAGKYLSVRKILETIVNSSKSGSDLIEEAKYFHYLGTPLMAALIAHLYHETEGKTLAASNKTSAEFMCNFVYKYMRFFKISNDLLEKIINLHFDFQMNKKTTFKRTHKRGIYEGNEPSFIDEEVLGTFRSYKGDKMFGLWKDKKIKEGVIFYQNDNIYKGEIFKELPHGYGWMKTRNGNTFNGNWSNGEFLIGSQIFHYGEGVYGELIDAGGVRTGVTVYHNVDKQNTKKQNNIKEIEQCLKGVDSSGLYIGEYSHEKREGYGTMYFTDKSVYHGNWKKDKRNGKGIYFGINREKYNGEWTNDRRNGYGQMVFENGDWYVGDWKVDRMEGKGSHKAFDGDLREGNWKNNFFVSKLRENKKEHDGININRVSDNKSHKFMKTVNQEMKMFLGTLNQEKFSEDILNQTKKIGLK